MWVRFEKYSLDSPWVHARIVGALEFTGLSVALLVIPGAVGPGGHLATLQWNCWGAKPVENKKKQLPL